MEIETEIRSQIQSYKHNRYFGNLLLEEKVDKIFQDLGLDTFWHMVLNIFTFGWYNSSRKEMIEEIIIDETFNKKFTPTFYTAPTRSPSPPSRYYLEDGDLRMFDVAL